MASPAGIGGSLAGWPRLRLCYDGNWFVRLRGFVLRSVLQLFTAYIKGDDVLFFAEIETQGLPADRDFSASDPEEPAEVDHRGVRLSFLVEQHIHDAAHILAFGAHHVPAHY